MNALMRLLAGSLVLSLAACSSGSDSSSNPPPVTAPSALSYTTPQTYTRDTAIAALNPSVSGSPTSYSIAPALPAGLALNTTSGSITGTPTALQAATTYTVTATNSGGSSTAGISIAVNDVVPSITYPRATYTFATGAEIIGVEPTATGGAVVSWSISGTLPAGVTFNTTNGEITGTPTAVAASSNHIVTATNSGGSDTFALAIDVRNGTLFELGHAASIHAITYAGSRIMSADNDGYVRLFDAQTASIIVATEPACDVTCGDLANLAGSTFVVRRLAGYDVYNALTGALVSQIAVPAVAGTRWKISTDGAYLVAWNATGLTAWSTSGTTLVTRAGNYSNAGVFAAPAEIRVGNGAAGAQVIEYLAMPGGASTQSAAIIGTFHSWFGDGERFISRAAGTTVVIYSRAAVQQDTKALSSTTDVAGQGNWFWNTTNNSSISIYAVGASTSPSATFNTDGSTLFPSTTSIGLVSETAGPQVSVIDLSGATPTMADYTTRTAFNRSYAARSATDFAVANREGVMFGAIASPQPIRYSYGLVRAVAGSSTRAAVTTGSGEVLYFNMTTGALEGDLSFSGRQVALSVNGSVLGVLADASVDAPCVCDRVLRLYSLPSENVLAEWPVTQANGARLINFILSDSGDLVGLVSSRTSAGVTTVTRELVRYDSTVLWTDSNPDSGNAPQTFHLSPSGQLVGAPSVEHPTLVAGSNIYTNGTLTGAPIGLSLGWVDDNRLVMATFRGSGTINNLPVFDGTKIVNPAGQTLATPPLPLVTFTNDLHSFQRVTANSIYVPALNTILDVNSGDTLWTSTTEMQWPIGGAVAGDYVVFGSGSTIRAEPR